MLWCAAVLALVAGAVVLYRNDPSVPGTFPACPFWALTGIYCPGCGSTRGVHALLHGEPLAALGFNPLMVLALPYLGLAAARRTAAIWRPQVERRRPRPLSAGWIRTLAVLVMAFWVLRNVPLWPLSVLAP